MRPAAQLLFATWASLAFADEAKPPRYETLVEGAQEPPTPGKPGSRVTRKDLDERQPRSAPDALRQEAGVYIQQTSAGQGSAFVRGRTGQQTLLLFDGIRLNNSLFRQGPNQYFFTIDARTVERFEVTRGGGGTLHGADAIGGVIEAIPREPWAGARGVRPSLQLRATTADEELGGRAQLDLRPADWIAVSGGVGYRQVGLLESGGAVIGPDADEPPPVPRFDDDGRTQLGTGFEELASDVRVVVDAGAYGSWTAAVYDYRQLDAPRTDQCPPPAAPVSECLRYDEQFHLLAYLAFAGDLGPAAEQTRITLSLQRQHERRTRERPASFVENGGRDDVITVGAAAKLGTATRALSRLATARLDWGGDVYHDRVDSVAWTIFTDLDAVILASRGQYLAGSRYTTGGVFLATEVGLGDRVLVRAGVRGAGAAAFAPGDPESSTAGVDRSWWTVVGHGGVEWRVLPTVALLAGADRSFRPPNLDDLTARQQSGPGYQFENPALVPETALTVELGARWERRKLRLEGWLFTSRLADAITRATRGAADCPPATPDCLAAGSRFQLVNLDGTAEIYGAEASARARLPRNLEARAVISWALGQGPNPQERPSDPLLPYDETVPLSRIPPLNGVVELRWAGPRRVVVGAAARWALLQDRLAPSDRSDARIPAGGTPGFVTVDLRASWRMDHRLRVTLIVENLGDAAYRQHGSSINGPGRGIIVAVEGSL